MVKVKNNWNRKEYIVKEMKDRIVTLVCVEDNREFTIDRSEFYFSYKEVK